MKQGSERPRRPRVLSRYKRDTRSRHVTSNIHCVYSSDPLRGLLPELRTPGQATPGPCIRGAGGLGARVQEGLLSLLMEGKGPHSGSRAVSTAPPPPPTEILDSYVRCGWEFSVMGFSFNNRSRRAAWARQTKPLCTRRPLSERGASGRQSALREHPSKEPPLPGPHLQPRTFGAAQLAGRTAPRGH